MIPDDLADKAARAVWQCQQHFWQALQQKDHHMLGQVLATDFICRSPGQPDQSRATFIQTLTTMPIAIVSVAAEQAAIHVFENIAVLTGTQAAHLRLPDGSGTCERLALTNIFQRTSGRWQMVLVHPVPLPPQAPG